MREVLKTNNPVLLDFAQVLLVDAGIDAQVFDSHMSVMDGSLGILPRRIMVPDEQHGRAETILRDGLAADARRAGDGFLDGKVVARQPEEGFRSGLDAVMLAASVPARAGDSALELGSGAGVASLCLAARVQDCRVTGVEIDASLAAAANENARINASRARFVCADVFQLPQELRREFPHVFCNPPFHGEGARSPDDARARALHDNGRLADWLQAGLKRTASNGSFTAILRADRLDEALAALPSAGLRILPLWPKAGVPARRVIVSLWKDSRAPLLLLPGLVLHESNGDWTDAADAVLREGKAIDLG
ncbi:MAG: putative signal transducing protein [Rhizomicrobium sp.]